jgi:hypothetical protein
MTAHLGRRLRDDEQVHHGRLGKLNDSIKNLKVLTTKAHNRHHKLGTKHTTATRNQIAESMRLAYANGIHKRANMRGKRNPFYGKRHTKAARTKISAARRKK